MYSTREATSLMIEMNDPDAEPTGLSRTRIRKPSDDCSM